MESSHLVIFSTSGKFITKLNVLRCISLSETLFWTRAKGSIPITLRPAQTRKHRGGSKNASWTQKMLLENFISIFCFQDADFVFNICCVGEQTRNHLGNTEEILTLNVSLIFPHLPYPSNIF